MQEVILFLMSYVTIYVIYQVFIISPARRGKKSNKKKKKNEVGEVIYLVKRYKLDMKKVNYNQLLQIIGLVSSFDIAVSVSLILLVDNFFLEIFVGFISVIVLILVSYHLVYLFYKKKGMICSE